MSPGLTRHCIGSLGLTRHSLTHLRAQAVPSRAEPFHGIPSASPTVCPIVDSVPANHRNTLNLEFSQNGIRLGNSSLSQDSRFPFCCSHSIARTEKRKRCTGSGTPHAHAPRVPAY